MKLLKFVLPLFIFSIILSCKKDDPAPTTGALSGIVTNQSNQALENAKVIAFEATNNTPVADALTNSEGYFKFDLSGGTYYVRISKQGYYENPRDGVTPIASQVDNGVETSVTYQLEAIENGSFGWIQGKVTSQEQSVSGALVVATVNQTAYSGYSDGDGDFIIHNVPAGNYAVNAWKSGFNSNAINVSVTVDTATVGADINLSATESGEVNGAITFLATNNGEIDVTLNHLITGEVIPGCFTNSENALYTISNVPNGTFEVRATYANDTYVVDPDWIIKNGIPTATINNNAVTQNFSVTGAVILNEPTNPIENTIPVEVESTTPTFSWTAYSSTNDYVIEVSDVNGNIIWGGFSGEGDQVTKNIIIPKAQTSIQFNSDGNATISALESGAIYRWKIYASKDDTKEATGWKLISSSEDQRGLIRVK
ncbi:carboxypeptidase regulatory-like domain-containing protein [Flammeovirga sp. MY04]|uniref:carboxypeptidase-like regulatory domain-containing protein n=1 Tax=Flammeovirga sp. MY04 TaxID=1191459 RepID=UPI000825931F|nr:carboxypeptidase-like regulatory domain-containing protein [Flammeovirga sp. MY04]ANQ49561.2 carboxypeptidase regulatory-like domain-containing protein [Flammeovirga sp. MY04]